MSVATKPSTVPAGDPPHTLALVRQLVKTANAIDSRVPIGQIVRALHIAADTLESDEKFAG